MYKTEWWGAGIVICLELGADLHMAQLMPLPLTVSCFSKIRTGYTFLVPAHPGSPGQRAVKRVFVLFIFQICHRRLLYSQTRLGRQHRDLIMSIHLDRVSSYPCLFRTLRCV